MWQWRQFVNFFFKSSCALCQRPSDDSICAYCWAKLEHCQLPLTDAMEAQVSEQEFEPSSGQSLMMVFAWGDYTGELRRAIAAFKYENQPLVGHPLGRALGEAWNQWMTQSHRKCLLPKPNSSPGFSQMPKNLIAVPIPMHAAKLKKRGFNQAVLIADAFCRTTGIPIAKGGLKRVRETQAQFSLSVQEREQNLADAFEPCSKWKGRSPKASILLIDDIYTTGATVRSAAQALQRIGCHVIGVAAVARPRVQSKRVKE